MINIEYKTKLPTTKHWVLEIHSSLVRDWIVGSHISRFFPNGDVYQMTDEPYLSLGFFSIHPLQWEGSSLVKYQLTGYCYFKTDDTGHLIPTV